MSVEALMFADTGCLKDYLFVCTIHYTCGDILVDRWEAGGKPRLNVFCVHREIFWRKFIYKFAQTEKLEPKTQYEIHLQTNLVAADV